MGPKDARCDYECNTLKHDDAYGIPVGDGWIREARQYCIDRAQNQPAKIATTSAISNIDACFGPVYRIYS